MCVYVYTCAKCVYMYTLASRFRLHACYTLSIYTYSHTIYTHSMYIHIVYIHTQYIHMHTSMHRVPLTHLGQHYQPQTLTAAGHCWTVIASAAMSKYMWLCICAYCILQTLRALNIVYNGRWWRLPQLVHVHACTCILYSSDSSHTTYCLTVGSGCVHCSVYTCVCICAF